MPVKRSSRARQPSSRAVQAAASEPPARKRARLAANTPAPRASASYAPEPASQEVTEPAPPEVTVPPHLLETLVSRVVDEVTVRLASQQTTQSPESVVPVLAPLRNTSSAAPQVPLSTLTEVPVAPSPNTVVQASVAAAHSALSGEPLALTNPVPETLFTSPSVAIDARVSDKLKAKIYSNENFEFSLLLSNPMLENKFQITINNADHIPSLCLEPVAKTKKFLTMESWLSCFHIFVGVYTRRYPTEAPALMKYGEVIQDLAARGHNWAFYDQNFRFLRQAQPSSFPWSNIHWELWMRSQQPFTRKHTPAPPQSKAKFERTPKGYCFRFSKGLECAGCAYKHRCFKCEGTHQPKNCHFHGRGLTPKPTSQPAKPSITNPQSM